MHPINWLLTVGCCVSSASSHNVLYLRLRTRRRRLPLFLATRQAYPRAHHLPPDLSSRTRTATPQPRSHMPAARPHLIRPIGLGLESSVWPSPIALRFGLDGDLRRQRRARRLRPRARPAGLLRRRLHSGHGHVRRRSSTTNGSSRCRLISQGEETRAGLIVAVSKAATREASQGFPSRPRSSRIALSDRSSTGPLFVTWRISLVRSEAARFSTASASDQLATVSSHADRRRRPFWSRHS